MTRSYAKALLAFVPLLAASMLPGCDTDDAQASVAGAPPTVLARGVVDVEGGLVSIRPQRTGQLVRIDAALGQDVSRGTILATLQGSAEYAEAEAARAELRRARAELANARHERDALQEQMSRVREAVALGAESGHVRDELQAQLDARAGAIPVAEASVAAAEARTRAAGFIAESTAIRAPTDGRVVQVNARTGEVVSATEGPAMFLLRPKSALIVRASIPERDVSHVHVGSQASISPADDDGTAYDGRVLLLSELARKPDPAVSSDDFASERVVDCVIQVDPKAALRVGSLVMVRFR